MNIEIKTTDELAQLIDHTILNADASFEDISRVCEEARTYRFKTVCVNSARIARCAELLEGSKVLPISVVGFPLGAMTTESKAYEASNAILAGAKEIDMVINVGLLKDRDFRRVIEDISAIVKASAPYPVKVIIETSLLTREEKIAVCKASVDAGAAFVKTSTGFSTAGANADDIKLMREIVGESMGVKASGGIRSWEKAELMINAGANRIGASASIKILEEFIEARNV
ncbi:MAG: deoxyribose-phosphate aldolase [Planctomycetes bacterium]|nr:deoxyribose-phosphate aldolase [Planctomycetota bacterium]